MVVLNRIPKFRRRQRPCRPGNSSRINGQAAFRRIHIAYTRKVNGNLVRMKACYASASAKYAEGQGMDMLFFEFVQQFSHLGRSLRFYNQYRKTAAMFTKAVAGIDQRRKITDVPACLGLYFNIPLKPAVDAPAKKQNAHRQAEHDRKD